MRLYFIDRLRVFRVGVDPSHGLQDPGLCDMFVHLLDQVDSPVETNIIVDSEMRVR